MNNVQTQPGWGIHTPNDGSAIGGIQPAIYGFWRGAPLTGTQAMLAVEGPAYATVEAYISLPSIASNELQLSFDLTVDGPSLAALMLIEIDLKRSNGKILCNYSTQRRLDLANIMQVSDARGSWVSSNYSAPVLQSGVSMHHVIDYAQEPVSLIYGTQAIDVDGVLGLIHPELQSLAPQATTWPAQELIQIQITLGSTAGRAFILLDNLNLIAV